MRGRGSKAVWIFSENSSVLVALPVLKPHHLHCAWVLGDNIELANTRIFEVKIQNNFLKSFSLFLFYDYPATLMLPMFWNDLGTVMFWPQ